MVLAYCDESLLHMEVPRPHVISEPTRTLGGEVLAYERVLDSLYFCDDSFLNGYRRNNPIFECWSNTLSVDL